MTTDNVRVLKTGTCPSLSGKSKLTYEIGVRVGLRDLRPHHEEHRRRDVRQGLGRS